MQDETSVDLRSDTVTRPSAGMRRALAEAPVGDDVFGDDPTVNRLQERVAKLMGMEAALFLPSGTMANQVALRALTQPGDQIIAHADSHVYQYESGAPAALAGCSFCLLPGRRGIFEVDALRQAVRPDDSHYPHSALVVVENTHNRGGGAVWPLERVDQVCEAAHTLGLATHIDGARLLNACVKTGHAPAAYARHFDTVSTCFSKGLGAPVGSALAGSAKLIGRAHRYRKMFGGGMRQAGILAAAALYALDHNVDRLAEDHAHARQLADVVAQLAPAIIDAATVETNIVIFDVDPGFGTAQKVCDALKAQGVWMLAIGPQRVRAVTHLDVSAHGIERAIAALRRVLA